MKTFLKIEKTSAYCREKAEIKYLETRAHEEYKFKE